MINWLASFCIMAMTTLAAQLRKLQTPQSALLDQQKASAGRASLLFDSKDAAVLDKESAFAIGCSGLEQLCKLNPIFKKFSGPLFSDAAKNLQRAVQTKEQNAELDLCITEFLLRLCPYFMLRPAHKALEWLLFRFRVHEYNIQVLLQFAFPFHESNIFARVIQLIDFSDETTSWHFLESIKTQGSILTKKTLVTQCSRNPGLFRFVCDILLAQRAVNKGSALRPAINLTTAVIIGVIDQHGHLINDKLTSAIVAHVADALSYSKLNRNLEMTNASLMILAQLIRRQPSLKIEPLQLLLITMAKALSQENVNLGLLVLLVCCRFQPAMETLPQKVINALVSISGFPAKLESTLADAQIHQNKFLSFFAYGFFVWVLTEVAHDAVNFHILPYLSFLLATREQRCMVVKQFINAYVSVCSHEGKDKLPNALIVLQQLQQRAGDELDCVIEEKIRNDQHSKLVCDLVSSCRHILGVQHDLIESNETTVSLALVSKLAHLRAAALTKIMQEAKNIDADDFLKKAIRNILATESDSSVYTVFVDLLREDVLLKFVDAHEAVTLITERIIKFSRKKWFQSNLKLAKFACSYLSAAADKYVVVRLLLTASLLTRVKGESLLEECLKTDVAASHPELLSLQNFEVDAEALPDKCCADLARALSKSFAESSVEVSVRRLLTESIDDPIAQYAGFYFIKEQLLGRKAPIEVRALNVVLDSILPFLPDQNNEDSGNKVLNERVLPLNLVTGVLCALLRNLRKISNIDKLPSWHRDLDVFSDEIAFLKRVFYLAAERQKKYPDFRQVLKELLGTYLASGAARCNFLCGLLLGHLESTQEQEDLRLQSHALCFLLHLGKDVDQLETGITKDYVTASILVAILSPNKKVRRLVLSVLDNLENAEPFIVYLAKHTISASDTLAIFKCVATYHRHHKASLLERIIVDDSVSPIVRLGVMRLVVSSASSAIVEACLKMIRCYLSSTNSGVDAVNGEIMQLCLEKLSVDSNKRLSELQLKTFFDVLRSENDSFSLQALVYLSKDDSLIEKMSETETTVVMSHLVNMLLDTKLRAPRELVENALRTLCKRQPKLVISELKLVTVDELEKVCSVRKLKRMRLQGISRHSPAGNGELSDNHADDAEDPLSTKSWRRVIVLLELLHGVDKIQKVEEVVLSLYEVLKRTLEFPSDGLNVEYVRQCVLSCLLAHGISDELLRASRIQISLLIKALRLSQSPQTQHVILVLLNHMARIYPDEVLQNMTSVFTFMGTSLLRQEDEYSFQIVLQTIKSVIPILLEASKSKSNRNIVSKVTRVFIDCWPDIPEHRRHPIFMKLIETLGPSDYTWILVAQMVDYLLMKEYDLEECDFLNFMLAVVEELTLAAVLSSCYNLLKMALSVPLRQSEDAAVRSMNASKIDREILDLSQCDDQRLADFKSVCVMVVEQILSGSNFLAHAVRLYDDTHVEKETNIRIIKGDHLHEIEGAFELLLSICLEFVHALTIAVQKSNNDGDLIDSWNATISLLHDCVDRVNGVLQPDALIAVIYRLLNDEGQLPTIQRNALELLNDKLIAENSPFENCEQLLRLVEPLCVQISREYSSDLPPNVTLNLQTALITLKLICRRAPKPNNKVDIMFSVVSHCFRNFAKLPDVILGAALLFFAELCHSHSTKALGYLAKIMRKFLLISNMDSRSDAVLLGLVVCYHRLVENLAGFLSPYLPRLISDVCRLCGEQELQQNQHRDEPLNRQLQDICSRIGEVAPLRVLLPAVEDALAERPLIREHPFYLRHLLSVLKSAIGTSERSALDQQIQLIQTLVMCLLHYRQDAALVAHEKLKSDSETHTLNDFEHITSAEQFIVEFVTAVSLKMSEAAFRPFISRLFMWARQSSSEKASPFIAGDLQIDESNSNCNSRENIHRVATFYHLCSYLSKKLKSLFVLFAGQFIRHSCETISAYRVNDKTRLKSKTEIKAKTGIREKENVNEDPDSNYEIACKLSTSVWILDMLTNCFQYGGQTFLTTEIYKTVASSIVDEIDNVTEISGTFSYERRILTYVAPAIAHLAAACSAEADCRDLHVKVLSKTRSCLAHVRHGALQVFAAFVRRLGDDYVPLLPESVPFLAELMEDDNEDIERLTQEVINEMEQLLGEPLMKYF